MIEYLPELKIEDGFIMTDDRDRLDVWRHHRHGAQAIGQAVIDLLAGITKVESFAIASHLNPGLFKNRTPGKIYKVINVRIEEHEGYRTPFFFNPHDGSSIYAVLGPSSAASDPAIVAAVLSMKIDRDRRRFEDENLCIFRTTVLPQGYDPEWWAEKTK